jgi:hypothetical protein
MASGLLTSNVELDQTSPAEEVEMPNWKLDPLAVTGLRGWSYREPDGVPRRRPRRVRRAAARTLLALRRRWDRRTTSSSVEALAHRDRGDLHAG